MWFLRWREGTWIISETNPFILYTWKEELEGEEMLVQTDNRVRKTLQTRLRRKRWIWCWFLSLTTMASSVTSVCSLSVSFLIMMLTGHKSVSNATAVKPWLYCLLLSSGLESKQRTRKQYVMYVYNIIMWQLGY